MKNIKLGLFVRAKKIHEIIFTKLFLLISDEEIMDSAVGDQWPQVDFMCFQEVWDRYFTYSLIQKLRKSNFKYFLVDVAHHSWNYNFYFGSKW